MEKKEVDVDEVYGKITRSCHVSIGDTEIGELVVDVASKPIENVGALSEDSGGVRIGVPGGGA